MGRGLLIVIVFALGCGGSPPDPSQPRARQVVVTDTGQDHIVFDYFYFEEGKSELRVNQLAYADSLAKDLLRVQRIRQLAVVGHVSPGEPSPDELSAARAQVVVEALVTRGVERARLVPFAAGARVLRDTRDTEFANSINQCVGFIVVDSEPLDGRYQPIE